MRPSDVIDSLKRKLRPQPKSGAATAAAVAVGAASAIWLALRVRKDLYGPGGTKLSRYNRSIDKPWPREKH